MNAPVGLLEEEAGDAGLYFAPHHAFSLPPREAPGNREPKTFDSAK